MNTRDIMWIYNKYIGNLSNLRLQTNSDIDIVYNNVNELAHKQDDYNLEDWWEETMTRKSYTADFETTTNIDDCRVWAVAVCEIGAEDNIEHGTSIEWFIEWCRKNPCTNIYFHNLAFDGAFIMDYLERHGWTWVKERKDVKLLSYTTIINDANQVYAINLYFNKQHNITIYDSLKIIPLSIAQMAKSFNLDMRKGSLDYTAERDIDHELTQEEIAYIDNDVKIAAQALNQFLNEGLNKMTAASNAMYDYKNLNGGKKGFRMCFPYLEPEDDEFIRKAYRGGFTYVSPKYQGKVLGEGIVFDVNSLYPSVMNSCDGQKLPYGKPVWFNGKPHYIEAYPLWVAQITCSFRLRENHIPTIQLKGNYRYKQTEYLTKSDGEVTFTITNVDWELIKSHYYIYDLKWHGGFYFKGATFLFHSYVDKWIAIKNESTLNGNAGMRQIAKLMLNSLYGKFATKPTVYQRRPMIVNDVLRYVDIEPEERDPVYLPVGVFTTAWARYKTITSAQKVYDRFIYADTDSLHLIGTDIPDCIDVDSVKLGAWKHESTFYQAKFLRAKCYMEYEYGKDKPTIHVAGMPTNCHKDVTIDNFDFGSEYNGKLYTKRVKGGIVLVEDKMQIRR